MELALSLSELQFVCSKNLVVFEYYIHELDKLTCGYLS